MTTLDVENIIRQTVKFSDLNLSDKRSYLNLYEEIKNNIKQFKEKDRSYIMVDFIKYDKMDSYCLDIQIIYSDSLNDDIYLFYNFEDFVYEFVMKHRKDVIDDLLN